MSPEISPAPASDIISPIVTPDPIISNMPNPAVIQVKSYVSIQGDWTLVSDSTTTASGATDHLTITGYKGRPGDHFNFSDDGKLYITENAKNDTASYTITRDNKIVLSYAAQTDTAKTYAASLNVFNPVKLTAKCITLVSSVASPGGSTFRTIQLKK
ncbi:MAG TPA: hypothetical protein VGM63_24515 [Mucilaginibacter sp.]